MTQLLYFLIAIGATTAGALTGMGGGVIIKPVMDVLGAYDAATIGVLSSITVFSMSVVSIGKQMLAKTPIPFATAIPLAIGSVAGGQAGQMMLTALTAGLPNAQVTAVQNVVLGLLILAVYWYMKHKQSIPGKHWDSLLPALLVALLGGLGGGACRLRPFRRPGDGGGGHRRRLHRCGAEQKAAGKDGGKGLQRSAAAGFSHLRL